MYYKIEKSGCCEDRGLCQIRYDCYHEEGEQGYDEHHVLVPIFPASGYPGAKNADGSPINQPDFNEWLATLPTEWQDNPFCCHFIQAEPTITDEEILYVGELALSMSHNNYVFGRLSANKNLPVNFSNEPNKKKQSSDRIAKVVTTDFTSIPVKSTVPYRVRC